MRIIKGNKKIANFGLQEYQNLVQKHENIVVDLGTGEGRFIYKSALQSPKTLFIGIDPSQKSLEEYSKKAQKNHLENTLFVLGSLENLPPEIQNVSKIFIQLPWGTLLENVVNPASEILETLKSLLASKGCIEIIFGYDPTLEPTESKRLNLDNISLESLKTKTIPIWEKAGFQLVEIRHGYKELLEEIESTWSKKLLFGSSRPFFKLIFQK